MITRCGFRVSVEFDLAIKRVTIRPFASSASRSGTSAFPDTRRPTTDGTPTHLRRHTTHDSLAAKARTEFRRNGYHPAWCLPRNIDYRGQRLGSGCGRSPL